jgi:hypothetical protein
LHKIEQQTWKRILAEKVLDARITLHVKNKPLADVLDWIGEQAGARWSTLYAVYGTAGALRSLDTALRGNGQLETAGWAKIAPKPPEDLQGPDVDSIQKPDGEPAGPISYRRGPVMMRRMVNGQVFVQAGNRTGVESWSPEELVLETRLKGRLGDVDIQKVSATTAAQTARKLQGKWTTCVAFRKSILGIGFAQPTHGDPGQAPLRIRENNRFARLTPEQRVVQARQRLQINER